MDIHFTINHSISKLCPYYIHPYSFCFYMCSNPSSFIILGLYKININDSTTMCTLEKKDFHPKTHMGQYNLGPLSIFLDSKLSRHPLWRGGRNHLLFNLYAGTWPEYREHELALENRQRALLVKASASEGKHRRGFDISFPLIHASHASKGGGKSLSISLSLCLPLSLSSHTPPPPQRPRLHPDMTPRSSAIASSSRASVI